MPSRLLDRIDRDDVRVVEGGDGARFALKAREPLGIARQFGRQHLQRDVAPELGVAGTIDLAHAACAKLVENSVVPKPNTGFQRSLIAHP